MAEYAFFLQKVDWWRKEMALLCGDISIFPLLHQFQLLCHSQAELSSLTSLKAWGMDKNSTMTSLFSWYRQRRKWQGLEIMVCQQYGWTLVRPGSPPWRKWLRNWLPVPPMDLIGLMPWCSYMRALAMCHSQGGACGHSTPERSGGNSLWADQPTGSPPTPCHWPPSCLPPRFEQAWWTCYNLLTRATGQQH